jgi:RIO-like serine/threonine protein kinase
VRSEVESLLAAAVSAADLYEDPHLLIAGAELALDALDGFAPERPFEGTTRYAVRRQIGVGGMGVVYEVHDRSRNQTVALKTLLRSNAADRYRLKREFRSLADIAHPNLVSLYELVADDRHCFFTMELVDGTTFVQYIRGSESASADEDRVRRALPQLIDGVQELHRRGKLHRDIKPSNVLVTAEGRVVILDFGLTSNLAGDDGGERGVVGTPAYLSPEQCRGLDATEASDWYGVGATLYHALTGRAPFEGDVGELIQRKITSDPIPPSAMAQNVAEDLNDLCMGFLSRDPGERMARRVDGLAASAFVGRQQYLDVLSAAFAAVKEGRSASVYIHGASGIGKSALVQEFFDRRLRGESLIALRGRCHEHESVPYKGLDGVIDSLSRYLAALPREVASLLMPRDAGALTQLFPVMRLDGAAATAIAEQDRADPVALRGRAFAALRELLSGLARRVPVVIDIDDFQWADVDSAVSLTELLRPPNPPSLLLLVSFRSEEIESKPFLRALIERIDTGTKIALPLAPMPDSEVAQLIETLAPHGVADRNAQLEIARHAGGNPFLVEQLARHAALAGDAGRDATLGEMLQRRFDSLPTGARALLETLAVCGRPILPARVFEACALEGDERPLVALLRSAHLLRTSRTADRVELYHDRIRETLAAEVSSDAARRIHELMARILVAHGDDDPEALFEHYRGAGHAALAADQAVAAAEKASAVLAFDRAAAFYRHALDLQPDGNRRARWMAGLARALENAGRPAEAADACLDAARGANDVQRIEWLRKAAEQLLVGGHIDRGIAIIDSVLPAIGMRPPRGQRGALASILLQRAQLRWRGLDFVARDASQIAAEDLRHRRLLVDHHRPRDGHKHSRGGIHARR